MSWDSYIDTLKQYSVQGAISEGVIVGKDNGALWTKPTTNLTALDEKALKQITGKMTESLTLNNVRFMFLRVVEGEDGSCQLFYKKKDVGSLCVQVTVKAIVIALTPEDKSHASGDANEATKKIGDYLISLGM